MNAPKVNHPSLRPSRAFPLALALAVLIPLSGCGSKRVAKPQDNSFPLGAVEGFGRVVTINPDLEVLTLQLKDRQASLWISPNTKYFHGKDKISAADIKPGSIIEFEGWSYGTDVTVKQVNLKD